MSDKTTEEIREETKVVPKSKKLLIILIVLGVILIVAGAVGASYLLPKGITGTWELVINPEVAVSTADEIPEADKAYYVFDKPDRYGRGEYHTCYQGGVEYYNYELMEENKVKKINLGSEDMEYRVTGSKLLGDAKLTIIFPEYTDETTGVSYEAQEYVFEYAKNPDYVNQSYKDYVIDNGIVGEKYTSNERSLTYYYYNIPYTQTLEFTKSGVMIIHYESADLGLDRYMYYAYTAKDSELTFSLVTDKDTKYTVAYEVDESGNLKFSNDITSSSIFADAFFGDFVFCTQDNLPKVTEASSDEQYLTE